ncbi:nuclear transport factor 2 family protein [Rhodonellum sp.]|uniref:nuclear transport factor 2 family protein n=1 Tax=Rhodonellum sp. TaxID=2231180 RepID=UPI0027251BF3|nr:nuclear transport factor 2 family protein [Rhodonellum sp.]MDO9554905.1 nuclear transport factor 2 family protein [Rhodonellum sp.]
MYRYFLLLIVFFIQFHAIAQEVKGSVPEELANEQLEGYNNRDVDAFVRPYADDVMVFDFPNTLLYQGKEEMKNLYGRMFSRTPDLHCHLVNRIVMGNTVIDHEEVTLKKGEKPMKAIAIYKIKGDKIAEVYFITEK